MSVLAFEARLNSGDMPLVPGALCTVPPHHLHPLTLAPAPVSELNPEDNLRCTTFHCSSSS
jgi:hypothetical protein